MRIDFYTQKHKSQRKQMFALSLQAGDTNFSDSREVMTLEKNLTDLLSDLRHHAHSEETFVHPLLVRKMPHAEKRLHHEHHELKIVLKELENNFSTIQLLTPSYVKSQEQGLEFYRALNRFISSYLTHINEEEYTMQNLWEIAADAELRGMMIAFQTDDGIEKGKKWLATNLPEMNTEEKILMFKTTQLMAPEKTFLSMCQLTEEILGKQSWETVKSKLGE